MKGSVAMIYVAGPYTSPDPVENTHKMCHIGTELVALGFAVVVPHISLLWHAITPMPYDTWLWLDLQVMLRCDAVLRVEGKSSGADAEVATAKEAGIPVFGSIAELLTALQPDGWR